MTGLQIEINKRKENKISSKNEQISIRGISKLLNKSFQCVSNKVEKNNFLVQEAILIASQFNTQDKFEALKYLFTEQ